MPTAGHVGKNTQSDKKLQEFSQLSITDKHEHSQLLQGHHPFPSMGVGCFTNKPIWEYRILVVPKGMREERDVSLTGRLISTVRQQYLPGHAYLLWHQYD